MTVFIADDDKIVRKGIRLILNRELPELKIVGEASDGRQAIAAITELRPDIVITDVKMPILDGVELVKLINALNAGIKTIVLSGYDDYAYVRNTMKNGALDYLLKPIDSKQLVSILKMISTSSARTIGKPDLSIVPQIVENARHFILKHYSEKITLTLVAQYVHLNPSYFSDLFKTHIGKTFGAFLTEVRISRAKELLINPQYKMYEVCTMVGYDEVVTFNRAFKRITGISPSDFRKSYYNI